MIQDQKNVRISLLVFLTLAGSFRSRHFLSAILTTKDYLEKIAIYFGTNMTLLFTSGIFLFFGKIVEDGILVFE